MNTMQQLNLIRAAVEYFANELDLKGQDHDYIIAMSQQMLADVVETDALGPLVFYVEKFCDVLDGPEDAGRIAAEILAAADQ